MNLDSARELKQSLTESVLHSDTAAARARSLAARAQALSTATAPPFIALGIAPRTKRDFQLAVRVQQRLLENSDVVENIRKQARGEVDIRYIGRAAKRAIPWYQKVCRPLKIGCSVGHFRVTAGTLGCFVRRCTDGAVMILSNNHVLANENRMRPGDPITQPGNLDGGSRRDDTIASLSRFVRLKRAHTNTLDCAVALLKDRIEFKYRNVPQIGRLAGLGPEFIDEGAKVAKFGRTTGPTRGRVTAFEIDNLVVEFEIGDLTFNNQIEIEGTGNAPFSDGGDSGSLVVNEDRQGIALLFAGTDIGGSNQQGLTYANPLSFVLNALDVELYH